MADRTSDVPTHRLIAERYALVEEIGREVYCVLARQDGAQLVGKRLAAP